MDISMFKGIKTYRILDLRKMWAGDALDDANKWICIDRDLHFIGILWDIVKQDFLL